MRLSGRARRFLLALLVALPLLMIAAGAVIVEGSLRVQRTGVGVRYGSGSALEVVARDGAVLRGTLLRGGDGSRCVIVLHGIGDSRLGALGFAEGFVRAGYSVVAADGRGHGESGGELVTYGVLEADDVRRWAGLARRELGCGRVYGLGESLGGSVLIMAASGETPLFDAVVAECAYSDLPSIAAYRVAERVGGQQWIAWPLVVGAEVYARARYGVDVWRASAVDAAGRMRVPLLLVHGLEDWRTPVAHSRRIYEAARGRVPVELWEVPGAGHVGASGVAREEFWSRVLGWFGRERR